MSLTFKILLGCALVVVTVFGVIKKVRVLYHFVFLHLPTSLISLIVFMSSLGVDNFTVSLLS